MLELIYSFFASMEKIFIYCISSINGILTLISFFSLLFGLFIVKKEKLKTYKRCKKNLKYYIPTRGQIIDPCSDEGKLSVNSEDLTTLFINKYLKDSETQYFLILADSGVGKTTFLDNLYIKYNKKIFNKNKIVYKSLSYNATIEEIKKNKRDEKTILLLDGFDEDPHAKDNYKKRLDEICKTTENFYKIIITCRTQFFPDSKSEPSRTGRIKFDVKNKNVEFIKYYISPFNEQEIINYLNKKFYRKLDKEKILRGKNLIDKCPDLMVRPMLLANIDTLLENNKIEYKYTYEIYEMLVDKWIERESIDNEILYAFSKKVARHMYYNNTIYIGKKDINRLCKKYNIELSDNEARTRSLLNRNANGSYKFSHKSILEYILATETLHDHALYSEMISKDFLGYDVTKQFLVEMCTKKLSDTQEELKSLNFPSYTLSSITICCSSINFCDFFKCNFSDILMIGTSIYDTNFQKAIFNDMSLKKITFINSNLGSALFKNAKFYDSEFKYDNLKNLNFEKDSLVDVSFVNCDFENASFNNVSIKKCNFEYIDFWNVNFEYVNFRNSNLNNVDYTNSILRNSIFKGCKLNRTHLENAFFDNVIFKGMDLKSTYLEGANLENTLLENINLIDANLKGINLKMSTLSNVNLKNANLKGANLEGTYLVDSVLKGANLAETCLKNIHLVNVSLEGVNINSSIWILEDIVYYEEQLKLADFEFILMDENGINERLYKKESN